MDVSLTRVGSLPQFTDYNIRRRKLDIVVNVLHLGTMSDTPRTDAEHAKTLTPAYEYVGAEWEAWEWARKLERELADLKKENLAIYTRKA